MLPVIAKNGLPVIYVGYPMRPQRLRKGEYALGGRLPNRFCVFDRKNDGQMNSYARFETAKPKNNTYAFCYTLIINEVDIGVKYANEECIPKLAVKYRLQFTYKGKRYNFQSSQYFCPDHPIVWHKLREMLKEHLHNVVAPKLSK